jgi:hypothetical protein
MKVYEKMMSKKIWVYNSYYNSNLIVEIVLAYLEIINRSMVSTI